MKHVAPTEAQRDGRRHRSALGTVGLLLTLVVVMHMISEAISRLDPTTISRTVGQTLLDLLLAQGLPAIVAVLILRQSAAMRMPLRRALPRLLVVAVGCAVLRMLIRSGIHGQPLALTYESVAQLVWYTVFILAGALIFREFSAAERQTRDQRRLREENARLATRALADLENEALRVRRDIASQLHGSLQQHLLLLSVELDSIALQLRDNEPLAAGRVRAVATRLDDLRENEVRSLSHVLFPVGADIGLLESLAVLLDRLPPSILPTLTCDDRARAAITHLSLPTRVLLYGVVEEGVTNALKHGRASTISVDLTFSNGALRLEILNNGDPLPSVPSPHHGLTRVADRLVLHKGQVALDTAADGRTRLSVTLPVAEEVSGT